MGITTTAWCKWFEWAREGLKSYLAFCLLTLDAVISSSSVQGWKVKILSICLRPLLSFRGCCSCRPCAAATKLARLGRLVSLLHFLLSLASPTSSWSAMKGLDCRCDVLWYYARVISWQQIAENVSSSGFLCKDFFWISGSVFVPAQSTFWVFVPGRSRAGTKTEPEIQKEIWKKSTRQHVFRNLLC